MSLVSAIEIQTGGFPTVELKKLDPILGVKVIVCLIIILCLFWYIVSFLLFIFPVGGSFAKDLTKNGLISLRPGMKEETVVDLIGEPLHKKKEYKYVVAKQAGTSVHRPTGNWIWVYSDSGLWGAGYEISVAMKDDILVDVYVEVSDLGVYRCTIQQCPLILKPDELEKLDRLTKDKKRK